MERIIYPITNTVNGKSGNVVLTADDLGSGTIKGDLEVTGDLIENGVRLEDKYIQFIKYSAELPATGWSNSAPYTQTLEVQGIETNDQLIIDLDMSSATIDTAGDLEYSWSLVGRIANGLNSIAAYCYTGKPTMNLPLNIVAAR